MGKIDVYTLGLRGVVLDKSAIHTTDGELLRAENWQIDGVGGRGGLRRRDGMAPFNAEPLAGPVLGGIGVPLADRSTLLRVFYLALNDGAQSFLVSDDGAAWSPTATFPTVPVREVTLGLENLHPVIGDAAMIWRGVGGTLYYSGDDYQNGGPTQPSVHAFNGQEDIAIARVPPNPADGGNTFGPHGITSIVPYGASQLLLAVADRTSGRARVLSLDVRNGALSQLGAATDLSTGHIISGIVVWQSRVWIAGVNVAAGGALVTRWLRPGDATWTTDNTFGTTQGYCTGLCVFKGELYQGTAADAGAPGLIRRRRQAAGGSATRTTSVLGGSTSVALGGNTTVVGNVIAGAAVVPVADIGMFLLTAGAAVVAGQAITYTGLTQTPMPAPAAAAAPGTGLAIGVFQYAITWRTPTGESLPSASVSVTVATVTPPATAPLAGTAQPGGRLDTGSHDYVLTFVTAAGETTPSPISAAIPVGPVTTGQIPAPGSAPTTGTPVVGSGPDKGKHEYLTTFMNAVGETTAGPSSAPVTAAATTLVNPPGNSPTGHSDEYPSGNYQANTTYTFAFTWVTALGETTLSGSQSITTLPLVAGHYAFRMITLNPASNGPAGVIGANVYQNISGVYRLQGAFAGVSAGADYHSSTFSTSGAPAPSTNTAGVQAPHNMIPVFNIPTGPPGVVARRIYRRFNQSGSFGLIAYLNDNGTTSFNDNLPNSALGAPPPATNTTGTTTPYAQVPLSGLVVGPDGVLGRNLYRRFNGAGPFLLLANLNPTDATYLDQNGNSTLVGRPTVPTSNTAMANRVNLTGIAIGPAGTTSRRVYRTPVNGTQLQYLMVFDDNVTTSWLDRFDDTFLQAPVPPTIDTTGFAKPGSLTGVLGLGAAVTNGAAITPAVPAGATTLPVAELAPFFAPGAVSVAGQILSFTGRSAASGPGSLTGVTGIVAGVPHGTTVVLSVPAGATALPVGDTTNFSSTGGNALVGAQPIAYTGRTTTSGPGVLTGVTGLTGAASVGTSVAVLVAPAAVWATVYTSDGTTAGNSVGPFIVTADGGTILAFRNAASGVFILRSVDGVQWPIEFNITSFLGPTYTRSGMPLLDPETDDIYWPLASGSSGGGSGGLLKRSAAGVWSIPVWGRTNIRGPIGIVRIAGGD